MICSISVSFQFQSHFKKNFRVVGCTLENEHKQIRRYRGTLLLSGEKIELSRSFLFLNIGRIINNIIIFLFSFFRQISNQDYFDHAVWISSYPTWLNPRSFEPILQKYNLEYLLHFSTPLIRYLEIHHRHHRRRRC